MKNIGNLFKHLFTLSLTYLVEKSKEIFNNLLLGKKNKTIANKLLKLLNFLEGAFKLIIKKVY